jgi:hypothetical protein
MVRFVPAPTIVARMEMRIIEQMHFDCFISQPFESKTFSRLTLELTGRAFNLEIIQLHGERQANSRSG